MIVLRVDSSLPEVDVIARAADELSRGRLVAFPTETVYGLGALATDEAAVRRVFDTKGRPPTHPLIAHVLDVAAGRLLSSRWTTAADALAAAFWPGPMTIIVAKADHVSSLITGGGDSIAIRAPSHPVARALIQAANSPIVAPSANRYQTLSPTRAEHIVHSLAGADILVLDGGACPGGIESTVVDARTNPPTILRLGSITPKAVSAIVGAIHIHTAHTSPTPHLSPGMDARHYAPRARLIICSTRQEAIARARSSNAALILFGPNDEPNAITLPLHPEAAAHDLYATLHAIDATGTLEVVIEHPPKTPDWEAIIDRLTRAST